MEKKAYQTRWSAVAAVLITWAALNIGQKLVSYAFNAPDGIMGGFQSASWAEVLFPLYMFIASLILGTFSIAIQRNRDKRGKPNT